MTTENTTQIKNLSHTSFICGQGRTGICIKPEITLTCTTSVLYVSDLIKNGWA